MSFNKTILEGRLGADPVIKVFDNGSKVATFSIATTERGYKTKDGKEIPDRTDWHNIKVFGSLATVVEKYVKKGSQLLVSGKLRNREYEKDGHKFRVTEVHAEEIDLLGGKPQAGTTSESSPQAEYNNASPFESLPPVEGEDDLPF